MAPSDIQRLHERLDDVFQLLGDVRAEVAGINERCPRCQEIVDKHEATLRNIETQFEVMKVKGTLSYKALTALILATGSVAGGVCSAIVEIIKWAGA